MANVEVIVTVILASVFCTSIVSANCPDGLCCYDVLHRYSCGKNGYTTDYNLITRLLHKSECSWQGPVARVGLKPNCGCDELVPAYRYRDINKGEYLVVTDAQKVEATRRGMGLSEIAFFCAPTEGVCGATVKLQRYYNPKTFDYIYCETEACGDKYVKQFQYTKEDVVCYVWQ